MKLLKAFKTASVHTKIFLFVAIGTALLTVWSCFYPYLWQAEHRSARQITPSELKK